jgi:hypothetical protein
MEEARKVLNQAAGRGVDAVEELERQGLLATPDRLERERRIGLSELLTALDRWAPHEMARRRPGAPITAAEMYETVKGFIEEFRDYKGK